MKKNASSMYNSWVALYQLTKLQMDDTNDALFFVVISPMSNWNSIAYAIVDHLRCNTHVAPYGWQLFRLIHRAKHHPGHPENRDRLWNANFINILECMHI